MFPNSFKKKVYLYTLFIDLNPNDHEGLHLQALHESQALTPVHLSWRVARV